MRIPVDGGSLTVVPIVVLDNVRAFFWSVAEKGIFTLEGGKMERDFDAVDVYDFATGTRTRLGRLPWRVSRRCGRISVSRERTLAGHHSRRPARHESDARRQLPLDVRLHRNTQPNSSVRGRGAIPVERRISQSLQTRKTP